MATSFSQSGPEGSLQRRPHKLFIACVNSVVNHVKRLSRFAGLINNSTLHESLQLAAAAALVGGPICSDALVPGLAKAQFQATNQDMAAVFQHLAPQLLAQCDV